jgi:hypothetical protein
VSTRRAIDAGLTELVLGYLRTHREGGVLSRKVCQMFGFYPLGPVKMRPAPHRRRGEALACKSEGGHPSLSHKSRVSAGSPSVPPSSARFAETPSNSVLVTFFSTNDLWRTLSAGSLGEGDSLGRLSLSGKRRSATTLPNIPDRRLHRQPAS